MNISKGEQRAQWLFRDSLFTESPVIVWMLVDATTHMWAEDDLWYLVFSFLCEHLRDGFRSSGSSASTFTHLAISLTPILIPYGSSNSSLRAAFYIWQSFLSNDVLRADAPLPLDLFHLLL